MHARSRRFSRLVGVALVTAVAAGTPWPPDLTAAAEEAGSAAESSTGYRRGMDLFHAERYAEALPYFVAAREEAATHYGRDSREYATALNNLAELYRLLERYGDAEPLFLEALRIEEARLGAGDPGLARPLNNLALMYRAQGRYQEAERNLTRSLSILEDTLGRRHPDVAGSLNNLARLYETMGMNERALPLLERSLLIAEDMLGPAHPATQQISSNLARVSAALADAPAPASETEAASVAEASDPEPAPSVGRPAELVLPEAAAASEPILLWPVTRPADPQPDADVAAVEAAEAAEPEAVAAAPLPEIVEPEPAAGPAATAITEPEPEAVAEAAPLPEVADVEPEPAAAPEIETALLLPLPETRPSGWRWAKLPAGRYAIHLASVRSPISASEEWDRLRGILDLPGEIGQLEPERIELADQGVFYRVLGGPFASRAEAAAACRPIRDKGDYCAVLGTGD